MTTDRDGLAWAGPRPSGVGELRRRRQRRFVVRVLSLAIPVAAIFLGLALDPIVAPVLARAAGVLALGAGFVLGAWLLGGVGFVLFALGDRGWAWVRRVSSWPE